MRWARSTAPFSLGERGGKTKKRSPRCWQAVRTRPRIRCRHPPAPRGSGTACAARDCRGIRSRWPGGARVSLQHIPARDDVAGREVFPDHSGQGAHVERIDLDPVARVQSPICPEFSHRVGTRTKRSARVAHPAAQRLDQHSASFQIAQGAPHHRSGKRQTLATEQVDQLVFSPPRELSAQTQDLLGPPGGPGGPPSVMGTVGTTLQRVQVVRIKALSPTVEGLAADAEVSASESHAPPPHAVEIHPGQSNQSRPAQLLPRARELSRSG